MNFVNNKCVSPWNVCINKKPIDEEWVKLDEFKRLHNCMSQLMTQQFLTAFTGHSHTLHLCELLFAFRLSLGVLPLGIGKGGGTGIALLAMPFTFE